MFKRALDPEAEVFIVTAAQNATPVHEGFWGVLKQIEKDRNAEIIVIPIRYKNPTSRWTQSQANEETWVEEVKPYLWNVRKKLCENLMILGDIKTQPTASDPITGFDAISGSASAILGHTKVQMKCVPTPSYHMAKILTTTGACTKPNYTDSRAGKLGEFHHALAAVLIEVKGKKFFLRHIHFDNKTQSVTDLNTRYFADHAEEAPRPEALVMGDTHRDSIDPDVERATFGEGGIVETVRPRRLVWNDLLDAYAVNPHHKGNPFIAFGKMLANRGSIEDEVRRACEYVRSKTVGDIESVIVPSNHNDFLRRWIMSNDWRLDPLNARYYIRTVGAMLESVNMSARGMECADPFALSFPQFVDMSGIKLLADDESYQVSGVELGMHGDRGPNGARGSARNLRRIGVKSIIGHSHSPCIEEGAYQTGTSTYLRLEYNSGPSSWMNAHVLLHADGKRQVIFVIDGDWRI